MEITANDMRYSDFTKSDYETNKKNIFDTIVSHIAEANKNNEARIYIKDLEIVDETIDVIAKEDQWSTCLNKALDFYKKIEDYESCSTCQRLLTELNNKNKKPKKNDSKKN